MKLELKHLAPYLPYGLKLRQPVLRRGFRTRLITVNNILDTIERQNIIKPILRPLSDLTKNDFGGDLIEEFYTLDFEKQILRIVEDIRWVNQCDYLLIQLLIEKHYDIFGLIEKGLAIDINTLN